MELKPYQAEVISDLELFLEQVQMQKDTHGAFHDFWVKHPKTPLSPFSGTAIEPYKNNVPRVPHVCIKVPTAGGKTFIACNAIKTIFDAFDSKKAKAVLWLVPSVTILEQTITSLRDPSHPYRQKLNSHFGNRVEIFDKATLLQGTGFDASTVREQLSIMVFSFDSLRAKNKEDRKVFQENGNLQTFETLIAKDTDITLGAVIKYLNPLVIVDESHNAETDLSVDMLKEVNPSFILDLTATPRKNSNIISFIDALELKRENMVKLPVIVYNHQDKTEVINSSLQLQKRLETQAKEEEKKGGKYIRPIVLFQAQPKNGKSFLNEDEEKSNVQKLKEKLLELKIPEAQIKIKTANINEIKGLDLMSRTCEVRFIITINALKEGWDCPFAYILASLADKSSAVDVEQILGRILRQPYVMKHNFPLLNMSFVLTASSKFLDTLDNIVKGLNKAGFSDKDYKLTDIAAAEQGKKIDSLQQLGIFTLLENKKNDNEAENEIDTTKILNWENEMQTIDNEQFVNENKEESINAVTVLTPLAAIEKAAIAQNEDFEKTVSEIENSTNIVLPNAIQKLVKQYSIKEIFQEDANKLLLPQFFISEAANMFDPSEKRLLTFESLLKGFNLSTCDSNIVFDNVTSELYKIDLDDTKKEHTPTFVKLDGDIRESIVSYILDPSYKGQRVKNTTRLMMDFIGKQDPVSEQDVKKYISNVLEKFSEEQLLDLLEYKYKYADIFKRKINTLKEEYAKQKFKEYLHIDKVFAEASYSFAKTITLSETCKDFGKSLYEKEGSMNSLEEKVINQIANMPNIVFWTRNIERKGFKINGFINHYPDFIIQTKSGKIVVLETKGDHLDAEAKIDLGNFWINKVGNNYRYFLVYENRIVKGAYQLDAFLQTLRGM